MQWENSVNNHFLRAAEIFCSREEATSSASSQSVAFGSCRSWEPKTSLHSSPVLPRPPGQQKEVGGLSFGLWPSLALFAPPEVVGVRSNQRGNGS